MNTKSLILNAPEPKDAVGCACVQAYLEANAQLVPFLRKLARTTQGHWLLTNIFSQQVGEEAPKAASRLANFFVQHYVNYTEDFFKDFPWLESLGTPKMPKSPKRDAWVKSGIRVFQ